MKAPMMFYSACGCASGGFLQYGGDYPQLPVTGALICDDRYRTLVKSPGLQLLGVPAGGNCQTLMDKLEGSGESFLVQRSDGQVYPSRAPAVPLPVINAPTSGNYPAPSTFQFLVLLGAGNAMKTVAAPTAGAYSIQTLNGSFVFVDASSIPGLSTVAASSDFAANGQVLVTTTVSPGVYAAKKLAVSVNRTIAGFDDGNGNISYRRIPDNVALTHPIGVFSSLAADTLKGVDSNGNSVELPQAVGFGTGSQNDWTLLAFAPTSRKLAKAPLRTAAFASVATISGTTAAPTGYANLPSGHSLLPSADYNYSTVLVQATVSTSASPLIAFALFRDGVQIHEFNTRTVTTATFQYIDTNVPKGTHTYDLRWKRAVAGTAQNAIFTYSDISAITLP